MRLGYDALLLSPPYSGVHNAVEQAALALEARLGSDLVLFCPRGYPGRLQRPLRCGLVEAPVRGSSRLRRIAWEQLRLPGAARRAEVELLHAPAYVMPLGWRGPSLLTVHDLLALTHPEWCKRLNVLHFRLLLPPSLRRASLVVAPAEAVAAEIRSVGRVPAERVRVLPLGLGEDLRPASSEAEERVTARYGLQPPYLLFVGNLEPKKNLPGLLRVFGRLLAEFPHQLVLVGAPGWGDPRPWRRALEDLPPGRVKLLGYVARGDLPALYSGADLYLQLSLYEGFGLPPLEAMACGTPAVVSDRGALPEVVGSAALVVDPADEAACARQVADLLGDLGRRHDLAAAGRDHAARFTWQAHADGLLQLYREVLDHD